MVSLFPSPNVSSIRQMLTPSLKRSQIPSSNYLICLASWNTTAVSGNRIYLAHSSLKSARAHSSCLCLALQYSTETILWTVCPAVRGWGCHQHQSLGFMIPFPHIVSLYDSFSWREHLLQDHNKLEFSLCSQLSRAQVDENALFTLKHYNRMHFLCLT